MNTEEDEFKRIEAEAKRLAQERYALRRAAQDDDDTQVYTSDVALAEAYRCGFEAGAMAEREACEKLCNDWPNGRDDVYLIACAIRARGTT
tara:strand:+ start:99 stop:371 length:273 start_codon:yes stop_codon:yes gene_type:complete